MSAAVGEELERSGISAAPPSRVLPADVAAQAEQNQRPNVKQEKSPLLRCRHGYFPGGVDDTQRKNPSRAKNLREAPVWQSRPGHFSGRSDHVRGENTDNGTKTGPSATLAVRPRSDSRENWSLGREKNPTSPKHSNQVPPRDSGRWYLPECAFSFRRLADQSGRYDSATMPFGQSHLGFREGDTYDGGEIGRADAFACPSRLRFRRNGPS